jgi:hypothetical protein
LTNEYWLWKNNPPLSLDSGLVTISNGETYDMADPEQKRQMVTDGTLFFMETIVPIIKEHDPDALTTMGFFAPQFPNQTGIGGDWYVDTAPLMDTAPIDFWDFHAYADMDIDIFKQAENFGMVGYEEKPVLLGETGMGHAFVPSAQSAATIMAHGLPDPASRFRRLAVLGLLSLARRHERQTLGRRSKTMDFSSMPSRRTIGMIPARRPILR